MGWGHKIKSVFRSPSHWHLGKRKVNYNAGEYTAANTGIINKYSSLGDSDFNSMNKDEIRKEYEKLSGNQKAELGAHGDSFSGKDIYRQSNDVVNKLKSYLDRSDAVVKEQQDRARMLATSPGLDRYKSMLSGMAGDI